VSELKKILLILIIPVLGLIFSASLAAQPDDDLTRLFEDEDSAASGRTGQVPMPPLPPNSPAPPAPPQRETLLTPTGPTAETAPASPAPPPIALPAQAPAAVSPPPPEDRSEQTNSTVSSPSLSTDIPRVQGQVVSPPPPAWQRQSPESAGPVMPGGPMPEFDSSQGRWQQMDVGQFDRARNAGPTQPPVSGGSLTGDRPSAVPEPVIDNPPPQPQPANPAPADSGQSQLRELFSDLLPPTPPTETPPARGSVTRPLTPPPPRTPEAAAAPPSPPATGQVTRPLTPPPPPPAAPPAAERPINPPPADSPALSRAGSLLSEQGLINDPDSRRGSAQILTPAPPASPANQRSSEADRRNRTETRAAAPATQARTPKAGNSAGSQARTRKTQRPRPAAPAKPNLSVMVVNETGRPGVGENYRAVLSSMGYRVIGVTDGPSQPGGQTVIAYQDGRLSQAQALARHLPGQRVVVKGSQGQSAGAVVYVR
jgi:hypothetical protein